MSNVRMSAARLERMRSLRADISDAQLDAQSMSNDAADPVRQDRLAQAALRLLQAMAEVDAALGRDATLPERPPRGPEAAAMAARLVQALGFEGAKERVSERLYGPSGLAPRPYWAAVGKAIDAASHAALDRDAAPALVQKESK